MVIRFRNLLMLCTLGFSSLTAGGLDSISQAADWSRFRGPNGSGLAEDAKQLPTEFSATKNLKWKMELPGPGSSSPIVVGDRVIVTCWSGYGLSRENPGDMKALKLHLMSFDRQSGKQQWDAVVDPFYPEEPYQGMFAEHGYASHTPASDGEMVFAYFGKAGLFAFDMNGKKLWNKSVGTGTGFRGWGTASSPILYKDLVIVTASSESQSLVAFNKKTGEQVWKQEADGLAGTWGTPVLVEVDKTRTDLVIGVPYEIWGLNPDTGKLRWFCNATQDDSYCSSVVANGDTVYAIEGRSGGSFAVRAGGKDDVSKSHLVWSGNNRNRIGTPVVADGRIYFVAGKVITALDAKTGSEIYQSRLSSKAGGSSEAANPAPGSGGGPGGPGGYGGGPGGGGRGGRGGGMGGQDYSSPVVGDGKLYYVGRNGEIFVVKTGATFEQLAVNRLTDQVEDFSSTPAISGKQIFIRSSKHLYCVSE